jgi:hypothetical protein
MAKAATVRRVEAVQLDCQLLLEKSAQLRAVADRLRASARVVVILDRLSQESECVDDLAYHRACADALSLL